jgi:hypothetical protein
MGYGVRACPVVLLNRSQFGALESDDIDVLATTLPSDQRYLAVTRTFQDHGGPSLPEALQELLALGCGTVIVLPLFVPLDRRARWWLSKTLQRWLVAYPGPPVRLILADHLTPTNWWWKPA